MTHHRYHPDASDSIDEATWTAARIHTADSIDQRAWKDGVMYIFNTAFTARDWAPQGLVRAAVSDSAWSTQ